MTDFDRRIAGALDADDEAFLATLDDRRGLFAQMGDAMVGPLGGWAKMVFVMAALIALALFYSVYRAVIAVELRETVLWSAGAIALLTMQGFTKQWLFDRMNLNAVLREMKRLELRIARIEERR